VTYFTVFQLMAEIANPALAEGERDREGGGGRRSGDCSFQFNPVGTAKFTTGCDVAKGALARASVVYTQEGCAGRNRHQRQDRRQDDQCEIPDIRQGLADTLTAVGYPAASNPSVVKLAHPWDIFRRSRSPWCCC
jgi:hypothetical protein